MELSVKEHGQTEDYSDLLQRPYSLISISRSSLKKLALPYTEVHGLIKAGTYSSLKSLAL
jgi:hypothetical protein